MASAIIKKPIRFLRERRRLKFSRIGNLLKLSIRCLCSSELLWPSTSGFTDSQCVSLAVRQTLDISRASPSIIRLDPRSSQKLRCFRSGSDALTGNHFKRITRKLTKVLMTFSHFWPQVHAPVAVYSSRRDQRRPPFKFHVRGFCQEFALRSSWSVMCF